MGQADYLSVGDYNAVCYQCGAKRKASQLQKHWQGYLVCPEHWEPRHPQEWVRGLVDVQTVPWSQPPTAILITIQQPLLLDGMPFGSGDFFSYTLVTETGETLDMT